MDDDRPRSSITAGKLALAAIFVAGGFNHFRSPGFYLRIMPPYLPYPGELVAISGVFEVALGVLLLVPRMSRLAAWGLIALLIAIFPANIHVYFHRDQFPHPWIVHLLRLPLQGVLIWWAYTYARRGPWPIGTRPTTLASKSHDAGPH